MFCLGKFGGWGWEEFSRRGLGVWFKISADMTANRGLSRGVCVWFEMLGIPARGFCEGSVRVMSCRAGTICECLWVSCYGGRIVEFGARPLVAGATLLSGLQCGTHGDGASMAASRDLFWEFGGCSRREGCGSVSTNMTANGGLFKWDCWFEAGNPVF